MFNLLNFINKSTVKFNLTDNSEYIWENAWFIHVLAYKK